mmetsp:Transcript_51038/g.118916  ORF Transcript_51038/g.118916 Transcript_51038/m.118916 type:complete len:299 (-) Transcript_51038:1295-2191(-)
MLAGEVAIHSMVNLDGRPSVGVSVASERGQQRGAERDEKDHEQGADGPGQQTDLEALGAFVGQVAEVNQSSHSKEHQHQQRSGGELHDGLHGRHTTDGDHVHVEGHDLQGHKDAGEWLTPVDLELLDDCELLDNGHHLSHAKGGNQQASWLAALLPLAHEDQVEDGNADNPQDSHADHQEVVSARTLHANAISCVQTREASAAGHRGSVPAKCAGARLTTRAAHRFTKATIHGARVLHRREVAFGQQQPAGSFADGSFDAFLTQAIPEEGAFHTATHSFGFGALDLNPCLLATGCHCL